MNQYRGIFWVIFLGLFTFSCSNNSEKNEEERQVFFFDLQTYFDGEIERLSQTQPQVQKILFIGGEEETLKLDSLDYEKELAVFRQADINKVSWQDKYQADTTINAAGEPQSISYKALDEKLRTRQIDISFARGHAQQISIQKKVKSPVLESAQELVYQPNTGFSIAQKQKIKLLKEKELKVSVSYQ